MEVRGPANRYPKLDTEIQQLQQRIIEEERSQALDDNGESRIIIERVDSYYDYVNEKGEWEFVPAVYVGVVVQLCIITQTQMINSKQYYAIEALIVENGEESKISIQKRYSEFEALYTGLEAQFPGYMLPPIPQKDISQKFVQDEVAVERRKVFFQNLLDTLREHKLLRHSVLFVEFLRNAVTPSSAHSLGFSYEGLIFGSLSLILLLIWLSHFFCGLFSFPLSLCRKHSNPPPAVKVLGTPERNRAVAEHGH